MPQIRGTLAKEGEETGSRKGEIWGKEGIKSLHKQIPGSIMIEKDGKLVLYVTLEIDKDMRWLD
jgi:hypothetical protein